MNILIFTSSRSEYSLLSNLIKLLKKSSKHHVSLVVTGSHLSKKFGNTLSEILNDKINVANKIFTKVSKDNSYTVSKNFAHIINGLSTFIKKKKYDLLIILGDRYEILSACIVAILNNIKIAHIHGGEITQGSLDEKFRHSITKMSDYHFVATNNYKRRVIQMGERPQNVIKVGALCNDNINNFKPIKKKELEKMINFIFKKKNILVTLNPEIFHKEKNIKNFQNFFDVLNDFKDVGIIFTYPNVDQGNSLIIKMIKIFLKKNKNAKAYKSLGSKKYLSCMFYCDGVVGNSSSGIIEAPLMQKCSVNIGFRQLGRDQSNSIINSTYKKKKIRASILKLLANKTKYKKKDSPYHGENVSLKIYEKICSLKTKESQKKFFDLNTK